MTGIRTSTRTMGGMTDAPATPYLAVDLDVLSHNLENTARWARDRGLRLRPHAKTHKSPEIARRQIESGAVGLTVATVAEGEIFSRAGATDLFVAYPVWAAGERGARLRALAQGVALRVGVDSAEGAQHLGIALAGASASGLGEVGCGMRRPGGAPGEVLDVARAADRAGVRVAGVFTFPGHGYAPGGAAQAAADEAIALAKAAELLRGSGFDDLEVSGGSTPTLAHSDAGVLTEVRPGVSVFNDAQQVELGTCGWEDVALTAVGTVVSRGEGRFVLDAGGKVLGADRPGWATGAGRVPSMPDARVVLLSEHHAVVEVPAGAPLPELGERVAVAPNHVCAAANLAREYVVTVGGRVTRWPITAAGANP